MRIVQIIFGEIPEHLVPCISSVKKYARKKGIGYSIVSEIPLSFGVPPEHKKYAWYRCLSEHIKIDLLSTEKKVLVLDWDIYLYSGFDFDWNKPHLYNHPPECMIYNGDDLETFRVIKGYMPADVMAERLDLMKAILRYQSDTGKEFSVFDNEKVKHWCNYQTLRG